MQSFDTLIIGTGAAGYAAAERLATLAPDMQIAVLAQNRLDGTSRNAGSDKQTYYKLSCTDADSAEEMANAYTFGGAMHKDTAYVEAVNSLPCFLHLADLGVPFPKDKWGRFVGYQTDHDNRSRGSSVGPLTSKYMTELLEQRVNTFPNVSILEQRMPIKVLKNTEGAYGVLVLEQQGENAKLCAILAKDVIFATGGPATVYKDSVYPVSQKGALGVLGEAGVAMQNLTEWQYGLASIGVRWNVSGSYQQVIPKYYAQKPDGTCVSFLEDYFQSAEEAYHAVFLKGYQWPFDSKKLEGSSKVDVAVSEQTAKGYKVFMDFRENPTDYAFDRLSDTAKDYLLAAKAEGETPYERLQKLNPQAIEFYKNHGIDLSKEPLEIAVCAQHHNGGAEVDLHWETNVKHLFVLGEAAGAFGMYRPGGSALNDTQVSALRATEYIAKTQSKEPINNAQMEMAQTALKAEKDYLSTCQSSKTEMQDFSAQMSQVAGAFRALEQIETLYVAVTKQWEKKAYQISDFSFAELQKLYDYKNTLNAQRLVLKTMCEALPETGSRGGSFCTKHGTVLAEREEKRNFAIRTTEEKVSFVPLREMPDTSYNFETVWQAYNREISGR